MSLRQFRTVIKPLPDFKPHLHPGSHAIGMHDTLPLRFRRPSGSTNEPAISESERRSSQRRRIPRHLDAVVAIRVASHGTYLCRLSAHVARLSVHVARAYFQAWRAWKTLRSFEGFLRSRCLLTVAPLFVVLLRRCRYTLLSFLILTWNVHDWPV